MFTYKRSYVAYGFGMWCAWQAPRHDGFAYVIFCVNVVVAFLLTVLWEATGQREE